jgi:hypothetical protein
MHFVKSFKSILTPLLIICGMIVSVSASQRTLAISGIVVDSVTKQPVSQAMMLFFTAASLTSFDSSNSGDILNGQKLDTTYSGADGTFSYSLNASTDKKILLAAALKEGYKFAYKLKVILASSTIKLDTLKIVKNLGLTNDTLMVNGTVVDSVTGTPLEDCRIIMSGSGGMDTAGNTAVTSANGAFSQKVVVDTSKFKSFDYIVKMEGYQTAYGKKQFTSKEVDLGTISIRNLNAGVAPGMKPVNPIRRVVAIKSYSINGRLLNSGTIRSFAAAKRQFRSSGIAIMLLTNNKEPLSVRKNITLQ